MKKKDVNKMKKDQAIKDIDKLKKDLFNFRFQKVNETIKVMIERKYQHPLFKKVVKSKKKYSAHDENNKFKVGDKVSIVECRPYSKNKKFEVIKDKI